MRTKTMIALAVLLCGSLMVGGGVWAMSSANYAINWNVIGGGGEAASSDNYNMRGTIGQPTAETSSSPNYQLGSGYWHEMAATAGNTPPVVSNPVASQELGTGTVEISYDVTDAEQATVTISFQYWSTWQDCITTTGEGSVSIGAGKEGTWDAKTDFDGQYLADCKIKVIANDGQASYNIGEAESPTFALDTRDPTGYGCSTPANDATDVSGNPTLTALAASDDSPPISYWFILAEDAVFTQGIQESGWQEDDNTWLPPTTLNYEDDYWWKVKARDAYGNEGDYSPAFEFTTASAPLEPVIAFDPTSLSFSATEGGANPADQTLDVWNSGADTLDWSISDDADWLSLSPETGSSIGPADITEVTVSVDMTGMSAGSYNATITITAIAATNSPQAVPVELTVNPSTDEDNPLVGVGLDSISDWLVMAYGYKAGEGVGGWTVYNPAWAVTHPEWNTLTTLYIQRGYWIDLSQACDLTYEANTYELDEGWNLIGWCGATAVSPPDPEDTPDAAVGLDSIEEQLVMAYGYKAGEGVGGWTVYNPEWAAAHPEWNSLTTLYVQRGYWIDVDQASSLEYGSQLYGLDEGWNLIGWLGW